jgi:hypothetical protein
MTELLADKMKQLEEQLEAEVQQRKQLEVAVQELSAQFKTRLELLEAKIKVERQQYPYAWWSRSLQPLTLQIRATDCPTRRTIEI